MCISMQIPNEGNEMGKEGKEQQRDLGQGNQGSSGR